MQGRDIVLQRLFDLARLAFGKPAERNAPEMGGHAPTQVELKVEIGQMGQPAGRQHEDETHDQRGRPDDRDGPGACAVDRTFGEQHAAKLGNRDERRDARDGADCLQQASDDKDAPNRGQ